MIKLKSIRPRMASPSATPICTLWHRRRSGNGGNVSVEMKQEKLSAHGLKVWI